METHFAQTSVEEKNYKIKWTIDKASKLISGIEVKKTFLLGGLYWDISFWKYDSYVTIKIVRDYSHTKIQNEIKFKVRDFNGKVYHEYTVKKYYDELGTFLKINFPNIEKTSLEELKLAPNDTWYLIFIIKTYQIIENLSTETLSQRVLEEKRQKSFCSSFWKMFENRIGTDVTLQVQDDLIEAHKFVLSAQSPVFAKMFEIPMSESEKNTVVIDDISKAALTKLIHFMYSKVEIEGSFETAMELYYAADKYEVLELRELCGKILTGLLVSDNAGLLLEMADKHKDDSLKSRVMEFINFNIKSCVKKDWWPELTGKKTELVKELLNFIK